MKDDASGDPFDLRTESAQFGAYYFEHCCGVPYRRDEHWMRFFGRIADRIVSDIAPRTVLDAGCAMGLLVEALRDRHVEATGIDISDYAIAHAPESVRHACRVASVTAELSQRYDLIVCIEVLEHMPAGDAERAIANFCRHSDDVLFSSSASDQREPTHVNVRPPEYWAEQFARQGFFRDVDFDAAFVTSWAVRFRRGGGSVLRLVRDYERTIAPLIFDRNERRAYASELQARIGAALARIGTLETQVRALEDERRRVEQILDEADDRFHDVQLAREADIARARAVWEAERRAQETAFFAERGQLRGELAAVRAALEVTHANLTNRINAYDDVRAGEASARAELARTSLELGRAQTTIANMERSLFWRLRKLLRRP